MFLSYTDPQQVSAQTVERLLDALWIWYYHVFKSGKERFCELSERSSLDRHSFLDSFRSWCRIAFPNQASFDSCARVRVYDHELTRSVKAWRYRMILTWDDIPALWRHNGQIAMLMLAANQAKIWWCDIMKFWAVDAPPCKPTVLLDFDFLCS